MKPLQLLNHLLAIALCYLWTIPVEAQNPVIHDRYTPDPAPYVHGDTLYLENETLNPYILQEAETINDCQGVLCEGDHNNSAMKKGLYIVNGKKVVK